MKISTTLFTLLILFIPALSFGQQLKIEEMAFAKSVEERSPVDPDTTFSADVESVFCFTKVANASDTTHITHVWYHEKEEMARIKLDVKSDTWRTWSSKKILPKWTGKWRVKVEDASGNVLETRSFVIR